MEINKLLDDCLRATSSKTDYEMEKKIGINRKRISDYRKGERIPDAYACSKIAEVLGMDEMKLIAHFEALSAKNPTVREYWEKKLERLGGMAAAIMMGYVTLIVTLGYPTPSQAASVLNTHNAFNTFYTLYEVIRLKMRRVKELLLSVVKIKSFCGSPVFQIG